MKSGMIHAAAALAVAGCCMCTPCNGKDADAPAAAKKTVDDAKAVAVEVNGKKLTYAELDTDIATILLTQKIPEGQLEDAKKFFRAQLAQQFVMKTLLLAEAQKKGVKVTEEDRRKAEEEMAKTSAKRPGAPKTFAEVIEKHPFGKERAQKEINESLIIQKLIEQEVVSKVAVDPKKVEDALKTAAEQVEKSKTAEATIKEIRKSLEGLKGDALKEKFAEIAKEKSDCPSKARGGDLGEFVRNQMVKEFDEVAFKIEPLVVSEPVKTQFGWHLILVTKKIPAVPAKGDEPESPEKVQASHILIKTDASGKVPAKEEVEKALRQQGAQAGIRKYLDGLRGAAKITAPDFPHLTR